jgi:hypothetical protein
MMPVVALMQELTLISEVDHHDREMNEIILGGLEIEVEKIITE